MIRNAHFLKVLAGHLEVFRDGLQRLFELDLRQPGLEAMLKLNELSQRRLRSDRPECKQTSVPMSLGTDAQSRHLLKRRSCKSAQTPDDFVVFAANGCHADQAPQDLVVDVRKRKSAHVVMCAKLRLTRVQPATQDLAESSAGNLAGQLGGGLQPPRGRLARHASLTMVENCQDRRHSRLSHLSDLPSDLFSPGISGGNDELAAEPHKRLDSSGELETFGVR